MSGPGQMIPGMTRAAWRGLGLLLLTGGVVLSLLGSARIEQVDKAWQSRPVYPLFAGGVGMMLAAVALLRWNRAERHDEEGGDGSGSTAALCHRLFAMVRAVLAGVPGEAGDEDVPLPLEVLRGAQAPAEDAAYILWLKLQLDPVLDQQFPDLMATRDAFRRRHGMHAFASLFSELAQAERLLSRAWSAAVDGYAEEARQSLQRGVQQLGVAEQVLRQVGTSA